MGAVDQLLDGRYTTTQMNATAASNQTAPRPPGTTPGAWCCAIWASTVASERSASITPSTSWPAGGRGSRVRAGRRVVDGANHGQQVRPLLVPKHARPVGAVELGERRRLRVARVAGLGALVHHCVDFARVGRQRDAAVLIEDPDALDARLAAQLPYDVVQRSRSLCSIS